MRGETKPVRQQQEESMADDSSDPDYQSDEHTGLKKSQKASWH